MHISDAHIRESKEKCIKIFLVVRLKGTILRVWISYLLDELKHPKEYFCSASNTDIHVCATF